MAFWQDRLCYDYREKEISTFYSMWRYANRGRSVSRRRWRKILMQCSCKHGTKLWNVLEDAKVLSGRTNAWKNDKEKQGEKGKWGRPLNAGEGTLNPHLFSSSPSKKITLYQVEWTQVGGNWSLKSMRQKELGYFKQA